MENDRKKKLRNIVNASGFLFQLRVEHAIRKSSNQHGWKVVSREHPWEDPESGGEGFIDLVLMHKAKCMIVECKRPRDASWVFLVPDDSHPEVQQVRCQVADYKTSQTPLGYWEDLNMEPSSPEAEFCVIRGKDKDSSPILERWSGGLLKALECFAQEELKLAQQNNDLPLVRVYFPVVITTAQLEVCRFKLGDVKLENGTLKDSQFETVPFIRFRKSLTTRLTNGETPKNIEETNQNRERTVLVINASRLSNILQEFRLSRSQYLTLSGSLLAMAARD